MNEYILSSEAAVWEEGSSKGGQPKYYDGGFWYKKDIVGYEGLAESIVSILLSCSDVEDYVVYEECIFNGMKGCRSRSFLLSGETFVSFQRLYDMYVGGDLLGKIISMNSVEERIEYVIRFVKDVSGFDCREYLSKLCSLACLTLNTDLHFHNMGLIVNERAGSWKAAPIFDNGRALLSDRSFFGYSDLEENIRSAVCQPFSSNFELQAYHAGVGVHIDYERFYQRIEGMEDSRALQVMRYQLEKYRGWYSLC